MFGSAPLRSCDAEQESGSRRGSEDAIIELVGLVHCLRWARMMVPATQGMAQYAASLNTDVPGAHAADAVMAAVDHAPSADTYQLSMQLVQGIPAMEQR